MTTWRGVKTAALGSLLLAAGGCDWLHDRFRECGHQTVELLNSEQSLGPVAILVEGERDSDEALLASGASRRLELCVERGDAKRFRAVRGGETLAVANCTVSRARYQYEATIVRVVWDARGLVCENW
jgi:hypothetical protein